MSETPNKTGTTDYLLSCVNSLRRSTELLDKSIEVVTESTRDVPRLTKILRVNNVFGLIPEPDLKHSITTVQNELKPKVDHLTGKYAKEIDQLRSQKSNMNNKIELQKVRLQNINKGDKNTRDDKLLRMNFLQTKRHRLEFMLSALNVQEQQMRIGIHHERDEV